MVRRDEISVVHKQAHYIFQYFRLKLKISKLIKWTPLAQRQQRHNFGESFASSQKLRQRGQKRR